jgi:hypothetical protein
MVNFIITRAVLILLYTSTNTEQTTYALLLIYAGTDALSAKEHQLQYKV